MPERPITAALQAVAAIVAAVAICLVLAAALHLPAGDAAPTPTPTSVAATPAIHPAPAQAKAPGEYVPTPAGPPATTTPERPGGARTRNPWKGRTRPAHHTTTQHLGGRMDPSSLPEQPHGPYPRPPRGQYLGFDRRTTMLHAALHGVKLGAFDRRTIDWLCHWCDTPTFLVVLGLVECARLAAQATPQREAADLRRQLDHTARPSGGR